MTPESRESLPQSVLHLGAGCVEVLDGYKQLGSTATVTLVEPNPEVAAMLSRAASKNSNVRVISGAVGSNAGRGKLNVFNFPDVASLREATGARDVLPGLRVVDQLDVEILPLADLLAQHRTHDGGSNWLVVNLPGQETELLGNAAASGALPRFEVLRVHCGERPLFDGGADVASIIKLLEPFSFDIDDLTSDRFGRICITFRRNIERGLLRETQQECAVLRERLANVENQCASLERQRAETLERLEQQISIAQDSRGAAEAAIAKYERAAKDHKEAVERAENLTSELERQRSKYERAAKDHKEAVGRVENLTSELEAQRTRFEQKRSKHTREIEAVQFEITQAKDALAAAKKRCAELEHEFARVNTQREAFERELVKLEAQMDLIRDIMGLQNAPRITSLPHSPELG